LGIGSGQSGGVSLGFGSEEEKGKEAGGGWRGVVVWRVGWGRGSKIRGVGRKRSKISAVACIVV
jgi:hypothetical protein